MKKSSSFPRRNFLQKSLALTAATSAAMSFEEMALFANAQTPAPPAANREGLTVPNGTIGNVKISRLICGGNLISGYAHGRDLIYLSRWLRKYFTDEKIMETWAISEQFGINTMIAYPGDPRAIEIYLKYRKQGGKIQYLAQINPTPDDLKTPVKQARDAGASGAFLLGNIADEWARSGAVGRIGELITLIKEQGMISGVAGHELRVPQLVEQAKIEPHFYMKTLHSTKYWSNRRPEQTKEVIDNYEVDNYWCMDPEQTIAFMKAVKRPWLAYKVLAAGAIHPRAGFRHAFSNGADFAVVGMFDFQIEENVKILHESLLQTQQRERPWCA
jgi:hypothetical protein